MTAIHPSVAAGLKPPPRRRSVGRLLGALVMLAVVALSGWGIFRWTTYPRIPDVNTIDLDSAISFMGSADFNRLLERHRLQYALAVVDRLGQAGFWQLLRMMATPDANRAQVAKNIRAVTGYDQIGAKMFAIFLEKYYALSPTERQAALLGIITIQQAQIANHPDEFKLPTADEFQRDMTRFMSRQPPRVQAMCGQFLIDLKRQRDAMGLKDPF